MESTRQYLLSVIAAAVICGIVISLTDKKGTQSAVIKLLSGIIMAVTVVSPWTNFQLTDLTAYTAGLSEAAQDSVQTGEIMSYEATAAIIKSSTEAYILDKAASMELNIAVEVTLSETDPPVPAAVSISGTVSPYAKETLKQYITAELGISEENQSWT